MVKFLRGPEVIRVAEHQHFTRYMLLAETDEHDPVTDKPYKIYRIDFDTPAKPDAHQWAARLAESYRRLVLIMDRRKTDRRSP